MTRLSVLALASTALIAAPLLAQSSAPTLKTHAAPLADALGGGTPVAKTWAAWNAQWKQALARLKGPIVGDAEEPELGKDFTIVPPEYASNFDTTGLLVPSWGTGAPPEPSREDVGAFRFMCAAGQVLRDDPIVFPGQPGKSHLHQFFGNTGANASSTYKSLRTTGDSTCVNPLLRSSYWIPAMMDGKGGVVRPDYLSGYYKRVPAGSRDCSDDPKARARYCVGIPRGIRYIFGFNMMADAPPTTYGTWSCVKPDGSPFAEPYYRTLPAAARDCKPGNLIGVSIGGPDCWDGKRLDSPDHRSHVAYGSYGSWGYLRCDDDHRYLMTGTTLGIFWMVEVGDKPEDWSLSSDDMTAMGHGKLAPGTSLHADIFPAIDPKVEELFFVNCILAHKSCNGGDLGNGQQLKDVTGFDWKAHPRKMPIPTA